MDFSKNADSPIYDLDEVFSKKCVTVCAANRITGYNNQYLRRLLRIGKLAGVRVDLAWLIHFDSLAL
jgi:hypothetical protein